MDTRIVPLVMDVAPNTSWDTGDYCAFFLTRIQQIQSKGLRICSIVHDNLAAQSNGLDQVITGLSQRPRIVDIPCFNHLINLVFVYSVRQNNDLRTLVSEVHKWQRLLKSLGINAPTAPKTRWLYIVDLIQVIISIPNLEDLVTANPQVVYDIFRRQVHGFPVAFVELRELLLPLLILSKKLEEWTTRLPDVFPLVSNGIQEWKTQRQHMGPGSLFISMLDTLISNLIVRVRSNAFDEAVAAFVLSVNGKEIIASRFRHEDPLPLIHGLDTVPSGQPENSEDAAEAALEFAVGPEMECQDFADDMEIVTSTFSPCDLDPASRVSEDTAASTGILFYCHYRDNMPRFLCPPSVLPQFAEHKWIPCFAGGFPGSLIPRCAPLAEANCDHLLQALFYRSNDAVATVSAVVPAIVQ